MRTKITRCAWARGEELLIRYHDQEWGVPVYDDRRLFEFLILEGAQAGLSWLTVLRKRDGYRRSFEGFDPVRIAAYDQRKLDGLQRDSGIIRNRRKIEAAVEGARAVLRVQAENGDFSRFIWQFTGGQPVQNAWRSPAEIPSRSETSEQMSRALRRAGFRFVGPTICYAFMQAVGMVNDHTVDCFRYRQVQLPRTGSRPGQYFNGGHTSGSTETG